MNVDALHTVGDPDWVAFIRGTVLQANDSFTWVKNRHNLKFGGVIMHVRNTSADTLGGTSPRGTYNFNSTMTSFRAMRAHTAIRRFYWARRPRRLAPASLPERPTRPIGRTPFSCRMIGRSCRVSH